MTDDKGLSRRSLPAQATGASFAIFGEDRPAVMVVSHERSGTHFLMNSLARGFGYASRPWIDLDYHHLPLNFHYPPSIAAALEMLAAERIASVVKSHHVVNFFDGVLDRVLDRIVIFYIHRDPVDVMLSFWRFIHRWQWHEGPKCVDPVAFAAAQPEGQLMRYQTHQCRNMLDRWGKHVMGWHEAAQYRPRLRLVPYAALRDNYGTTISSFSDLLGRSATDLTSPSPNDNVIKGAELPGQKPPDIDALKSLALRECGGAMRTLGYA
jgi:hypothetical protein